MAKKPQDRKSREAAAAERAVKLLLVDEDTNDLRHYSALLRSLGCDVLPVDSYASAADSLGHERFDLVMVDQGSSKFEGRSVVGRAIEVGGDVPVLVLTRVLDADCCLDALDSGASEYVQKPLAMSEVRELVGDYVKLPAETFPAGQNYRFQSGFAEKNKQEAGRESWRKAS